MPHYAALLRGIAPSGKNMSNDKLRAVFDGLGFTAVGSVLASGNIVFGSPQTDVPALEQQIETALNSELGIPGRTIVRSHAELRRLLDSDPFAGLTHGRGSYLTVTFLKGLPAEVTPEIPDGLTRVLGYDAAARAVFAITDNSDPGRTPEFMVWLERAYGKDVTTRTWLTVQRIITKLERPVGR